MLMKNWMPQPERRRTARGGRKMAIIASQQPIWEGREVSLGFGGRRGGMGGRRTTTMVMGLRVVLGQVGSIVISREDVWLVSLLRAFARVKLSLVCGYRK